MNPVYQSNGPRHEFGLYRSGHKAAAIWLSIRWLGRWWGLEVRWDPEVIGSKVMWTFADLDVGWLE